MLHCNITHFLNSCRQYSGSKLYVTKYQYADMLATCFLMVLFVVFTDMSVKFWFKTACYQECLNVCYMFPDAIIFGF